MELQSVGLREFRAHLHKYTRQGDEPIAITSHGETIGYYIPARPTPQAQQFMALKEAVRKLASILDASGVDAGDLAADFQAERQRDHPS
jgi:antitoxin (DNA-binding transcriptional repressor) of toxin-antitoxin stability system